MPRKKEVIGIDPGIPELVLEYTATQTLETKKRVSKNDVWNQAMRQFLKGVGLIKKGHPLWKEK